MSNRPIDPNDPDQQGSQPQGAYDPQGWPQQPTDPNAGAYGWPQQPGQQPPQPPYDPNAGAYGGPQPLGPPPPQPNYPPPPQPNYPPQQGYPPYGQAGYPPPPSFQQPYGQQPNYQPYGQPPVAPAPPALKSLPNADGALALGIISIATFWCYGIIGIICGIIGLSMAMTDEKKLRENPGMYRGAGNVQAAKVCSIIGLALSVLMLILIIMGVGSSRSFDPF